MRPLLTWFLLTSPLMAQNSDLGVIFSATVNRFNFGPRTETQYRIGLQVNYAWQFHESARGRLYAELAVSPQGAFITPGVRYHYQITPRLAFYGAAGLGAAVRHQRGFARPLHPPGPLVEAFSRWQTDPAFNVGAGADFRLTRLMSVRGELRRFRTTAQPGFGDGRTFPAAQAGLAVHF